MIFNYGLPIVRWYPTNFLNFITMDIPKKMCRICLKQCNDYKAVDEYIKDVLDVLLLKINLGVNEGPVVCAYCGDTLIKCFYFKSACLDVYGYLVSFVNNKKNGKINLKDVYQSKQEHAIDIPGDQNVCGLCMGLVNNSSAILLSTEQKNVEVEIMLKKYLPELDLDIIEEPIMCASCDTSLKDWFQFVMNCSAAEENVINYNDAACQGDLKPSEVPEIAIKEEKYSEVENANNVVKKMEDQTFLLHEKIEIKTEEQDFDGIQCSDVTTMADGENYHILVVHKHPLKLTIYRCKSCSFETRYRACIKRHQLTHRDPSELAMFNCESCPYKTKSKKYLIKHVWRRHGDIPEPVMLYCEFCSFKTKYRYHLRHHKLTHMDPSKIPMFHCESCPYKTKYKINLRNHEISHMDPSETTMYVCEVCSYKTKYKSGYRNHQLKHKDPSEMFHCDSCSFTTKYERSLKRHQKKHKRHEINITLITEDEIKYC